MKRSLLILLILTTFSQGAASAETIKLIDGSIIMGEVIGAVDGKLKIKTSYGEIQIDKTKISSIDYTAAKQQPDESEDPFGEADLTPMTPTAAPAPKHSGPWPYALGADQKTAAENAGLIYSETEFTAAQRLKARGFSDTDYVNGYLALAAAGAASVEDVDRGLIIAGTNLEDAVVLVYLGFSYEDVSNALSWGYSATEYYNYQFGGRGMKIAGWTLFSLGMATFLPAAIVLSGIETCGTQPENRYSDEHKDWYDCQSHNAGAFTVAILLTSIGATLGSVGLPLGIVGSVKTSHWAPENTLEAASVDALAEYSIDKPSEIKLDYPEAATGATIDRTFLPPTPQTSWGLGARGLVVRF